MKIVEEMYIRTKNGIIRKWTKYDKLITKWEERYNFKDNYDDLTFEVEKNIINASYNIIDLIGVGDFVNGMRIVAKDSDNRLYVAEDLGQPYDREFYNGCFEYTLLDERYKIKSIVTKEQFDSMKYEVDSNE